MRTATCKLRSIAPYCQSRRIAEERPKKEAHDDFEKRTWRQRMHVGPDGCVQIPGTALKFALMTAAGYLNMKIPGEGNSKYNKHFRGGVMPPEAVPLSTKAEDVEPQWIWAHSGGRRGTGTRVQRAMPKIPAWEAVVVFVVLDDKITNDVFEQVLREAGSFIGIGQSRPENGGDCGRFVVDEITWDES